MDATPKMDVAELVAASQAGDRVAFNALVASFEGWITALLVKKLRNKHDADECCQEVILIALKKIGTITTPCAFYGWIKGVAINVARNYMRKTGREGLLGEFTDLAQANDQPSPVDCGIAAERTANLSKLVSCLYEPERRAVESFYIDGCSISEIGLAEGVTDDVIKRRLSIARTSLRERIAWRTGIKQSKTALSAVDVDSSISGIVTRAEFAKIRIRTITRASIANRITQQCPRCCSNATRKSGYTSAGRQRYECHDCGKYFCGIATRYPGMRIPMEKCDAVVSALQRGLTLSTAARVVGVNKDTANRALRVLGFVRRCKKCAKPLPAGNRFWFCSDECQEWRTKRYKLAGASRNESNRI